MDDVVRCPDCPRWLGVLRAGHVESRRHGRTVKVVTGEIECEQCRGSVQIVNGRPMVRLAAVG